jgi:hypothetical protein
MSDTKHIEALLANIAESLNKIALALNASTEIRKSIGEYLDFDWASIGAKVLKSDADGPGVVEHSGKIYKRRAPDNRFAAAIWFSRCTGKAEDGANQYETLISFEQLSAEIEPIGRKARQILQSIITRQTKPIAPERKPEPQELTDAPITEAEAVELARIEAEHRAVEEQLKAIYLAVVANSEKAWNAYYNEKGFADMSLADKQALHKSWHATAIKKGFKISKVA